MTAPASATSAQLDLIKTSAAIISVIDNGASHDALRQQTPLNEHQIHDMEHWFSEGLDHWDRELKAHHAPNPITLSRTAIVAGFLEKRYPQGVKHDERDEITIPISDIVDAWNLLASDANQTSTTRRQWENIITHLFSFERDPLLGKAGETAEKMGHVVARTLGIGNIFNTILDAAPEVDPPPLPTYQENDERSRHLQLMMKLQLELSAVETMLQAITPDQPHETRASQLVQWAQSRANKALEAVTRMVVPTSLARFSSQLDKSARSLTEVRNLLNTCLYGTEAEVAAAAAQYSVERNFGTILFLAVVPNVPFIIPTLELRLAITKPLYFVTRGAHEALGDIPIFGLLFFAMRGLGWLIDAIPRTQVHLVQGIRVDAWLANKKKRDKLVDRYIHAVDRRLTHQNVDAVQRVLLSIVS
jgi:hypothetical protein